MHQVSDLQAILALYCVLIYSRLSGSLYRCPSRNSQPNNPFPPHFLCNSTRCHWILSVLALQDTSVTDLLAISLEYRIQCILSISSCSDWYLSSSQPRRQSPLASLALYAGDPIWTSDILQQFYWQVLGSSKRNSIPRKSSAPPQLLSGLIQMSRSFWSFVENTLNFTGLPTFYLTFCIMPARGSLCSGGDNRSRMSLGDCQGTKSTMKSKQGSTLVSKGEFSFTDKTLYPLKLLVPIFQSPNQYMIHGSQQISLSDTSDVNQEIILMRKDDKSDDFKKFFDRPANQSTIDFETYNQQKGKCGLCYIPVEEKFTCGMCKLNYCPEHMRKIRKIKNRDIRVCDNCDDKIIYEACMKSERQSQDAILTHEQIIRLQASEVKMAVAQKEQVFGALLEKKLGLQNTIQQTKTGIQQRSKDLEQVVRVLEKDTLKTQEDIQACSHRQRQLDSQKDLLPLQVIKEQERYAQEQLKFKQSLLDIQEATKRLSILQAQVQVQRIYKQEALKVQQTSKEDQQQQSQDMEQSRDTSQQKEETITLGVEKDSWKSQLSDTVQEPKLVPVVPSGDQEQQVELQKEEGKSLQAAKQMPGEVEKVETNETPANKPLKSKHSFSSEQFLKLKRIDEVYPTYSLTTFLSHHDKYGASLQKVASIKIQHQNLRKALADMKEKAKSKTIRRSPQMASLMAEKSKLEGLMEEIALEFESQSVLQKEFREKDKHCPPSLQEDHNMLLIQKKKIQKQIIHLERQTEVLMQAITKKELLLEDEYIDWESRQRNKMMNMSFIKPESKCQLF